MTDQKRVEEPSDRAKRKRNRKLNDTRTVLNIPEGRRDRWDILEFCGFFKQSHVPGDPYTTAFNEGRRSVGNWLMNWMLEAKPDSFNQMQREHASETKREETEDKDRVNTKSILETQ